MPVIVKQFYFTFRTTVPLYEWNGKSLCVYRGTTKQTTLYTMGCGSSQQWHRAVVIIDITFARARKFPTRLRHSLLRSSVQSVFRLCVGLLGKAVFSSFPNGEPSGTLVSVDIV